jgi:GTP-binding protein Era
MSNKFRCGYISIVGRPNVGKSTLLNHILGQKISITSRKPQTTRHNIMGIHSTEKAQFIFVDTPGMHGKAKKAMNRYLNRAASNAIKDVHAVIFVVEAEQWTDEDELVLQQLKQAEAPVIAVVNKVDRVEKKEALLPYLQQLSGKMAFQAIVPVAALKNKGLKQLESELYKLMPESEPYFDTEQITTRSERFLAAEIIREKLTRRLGQELPYGLTVEIERFEQEASGRRIINGLIWVERDSQKAIVIGKKGAVLKSVGIEAKQDMMRLFDSRVHLELWVKVKEGWADDERALQSLGYTDEH